MKHYLHWTSHQIPESQLRSYEIDFLKLLDYKVNITEIDLLRFYEDVRSCFPPELSSNIKNPAIPSTQQRAAQAPPPSHLQPVMPRSRTLSQPAPTDSNRRARRIPNYYTPASSTVVSSAYPTPSDPPSRHVEHNKKVHYPPQRHRVLSVRAPTPYYASYQPHQELSRASAYPTPTSTRSAAPVIPVIPPPALRRSKSQVTSLGKDVKQGGHSSLWKKMFTK
jgi:hypothetical protein